MNKIFKVVWSKVKNCYVVVSEIAKNTVSGVGKRNRVKRFSLGATLAAFALAGSFFVPNSALAESGVAEKGDYVAIKVQYSVGGQFINGVGAELPDGYIISNSLQGAAADNYEIVTIGDKDGVRADYFIRKGFEVVSYEANGSAERFEITEVKGSVQSGSILANTLTRDDDLKVNNTAVTTALGEVLRTTTTSPYVPISNGGGVEAYIRGTAGLWEYYIDVDGDGDGETNANQTFGKLFSAVESKDGQFYLDNNNNNTIDTGEMVSFENVYFLKADSNTDDVKPYVFFKTVDDKNDGDVSKIYTGNVTGGTGELLLTAQRETAPGQYEYVTYWAGKATDQNSLLADSGMTVGEFNHKFEVVDENFVKLGNADIKEITINSDAKKVSLIRNNGVPVDNSLVFGSGGGQEEGNKYVDTYVTIGQAKDLSAIKLNTGSLVRGEGKVVDGSGENKSLSKITINGEVFNVPLVVPNATAGENGETTYTLEYLKINDTTYKVAQSIQGEGHDWGLTGEINSTDSTNTPKGEQSGHYQLDANGTLRLNMLEKLTGNVEVDKIVVDGIASRDYVDGAIATEKAAREAADTVLNSRIDDEITNRTNADAALQVNIEAEAQVREAADIALNSRIDEEITNRETADTALNSRIDDEITNRANADAALQANIDAEAAERFANDIASGAINSQNGTISLTKNNGETITLNGAICDSRLDNVSYDASTGKMTFTVKDHYNNDVQNSIVVSDIASKTVLEAEIAERIQVDQALIEETKGLRSSINQLGSKVNKVGAGAAALAALHPMDFDPDDKLSFAVGAGNYAGENATALGAFYRPNEKVMMSVGGTMGNGENMVNLGVSFALDKTNNVSNSRTAMAREIVDLREQVATQGQQIAQLVALVQQLTGVQQGAVPADQLFPDIPENHWAYEYIHSLAVKGIVEGYPDGTFGGDRTMTRYEFATMLFRAMEKGVVLSEQIRQEFEKELGRVRVDRVKGTDADLNKIERVRVNTAVNRDDYGNKVVQVKH